MAESVPSFLGSFPSISQEGRLGNLLLSTAEHSALPGGPGIDPFIRSRALEIRIGSQGHWMRSRMKQLSRGVFKGN